jgi:hypothetical protein
MRGPRGKDVFARAPGVFARMLEVTGGRWPKNIPIPRAAGEDFFTSRMARDLRVFPYERNIAAVVSAVMNKDHQDAAQKCRLVVRMVDPVREAKRAWGSAKAAASGSGKLVPAAKTAAPGGSKASTGEKATKPPPGRPSPAKLPPPGKRVADFGTNISVDDYLVGKYIYIYICFFTEDVLQGRARDNWLSSCLRWQPPRHRRW